MRILQITDETRKDIKKVIEYAENNILDNARLADPKEFLPVGDNPDHVVHIHDGYRVVFSIEEQSIGLCNHISISVESKDKYPNEHAVNMILNEFNMSLDNSLSIWLEENVRAINILGKKI